MENNNKDNRIDFVWYRRSDGYSWDSAKNIHSKFESYFEQLKQIQWEIKDFEESAVIPNELYLADTISLSGDPYPYEYDSGIKAYRPLDDMALFANFAEIEAKPDNFITWSEKYGPLHTTAPFSYSESLDSWIEEHRDLSFALSVWELAVNKNTEKLKKIIRWTDNNTAVEVNYMDREFIEGVDTVNYIDSNLIIEDVDNDEYATQIQRHKSKEATVLFDKNNTRSWFSNLCRYPDVIRPAELYIQTVISQKLKDYPLNVEIKSDELGGNLYKTLRPSSLISAMWYQFFLVFTGEEQIRRCELCGKWEDMRGHRSSWKAHKTCASNERVKRFRKNGEN